MNIPGFHADASLYETSRYYQASRRSVIVSKQPNKAIYPAIARIGSFNPIALDSVNTDALFRPKWKDWCDNICSSQLAAADPYCQFFGLGNAQNESCICTKEDYQTYKATGMHSVRATWECGGGDFPPPQETEGIGL